MTTTPTLTSNGAAVETLTISSDGRTFALWSWAKQA